MLGDEGQVLVGSEGVQADNINFVVVGRVSDGESKYNQLLQVGLVDTAEGAGDDGETPSNRRSRALCSWEEPST